jgi:type III secretion protein L
MTGVIKAASSATIVRSFGPLADVIEAVPGLTEAELALQEARQEAARLNAALSELQAHALEAEKVAREEGRLRGLEQAGDRIERNFQAICQAVDAARTAWEDRLAGLDALAAMLAQSALAKLFGDAPDLADLVARTVRARVQALGRESVVAIRVSEQDFGDEAAREALRSIVAVGATTIVLDPELDRGDCRLDLRLGLIDLGVTSQWRELNRFLDGLASDEMRS